MLTSSSSMGTTTAKTLNSPLSQEEDAKTGEIEKKENNNNINKHLSSSLSSKDILSIRALKVKENLNKKEEVDAVILKYDGTSEQFKYNTSSKQANRILNGRPTIIGELEDIQIIIVRSLNQKNCGEVNKHTLPVPFCNQQYNGNYLLYRIDSRGNGLNLSLKQYQEYVISNKKLTQNAQKNYDPFDNQEIKTKPNSFSSNSRLTLVYLQSEVDKKIRQEFKEKNNKNSTESEIEKLVNESLQKLVNNLVSTSTSSPMNDPDYNPENDDNDNDNDDDDDDDMDDDEYINKLRQIYYDENGINISNKELISILSSTQNVSTIDDDIIDDRDWRLQLNDALNYVRERGKLDGRALATKISETFYELNGIEPSLNELINVFREIKCELADEAQSEIDDDENNENNEIIDDGSAYFLAKQLSSSFNNAHPSDLIDYAFRIVREDIINRSKSSFIISKGRNPNKNELKETVEKFALKLANDAIQNNIEKNIDADIIDDDDDDTDYDPNNITDNKLSNNDQLEDEEFNENNFNIKMTKTKSIKSKTGIAEKYDVYFCKFNKKKENENLLKAIDSFKMRNRREPTELEIYSIKQFISINNNYDSDNDHDEEEKDEILSEKEISIKTKKQKQTTPSKVLVTPIKKKKSAARYNVYFNDNKLNENRNEKLAIKWFKRFNNRNPTELELGGIHQFIKSDNCQLIECQYNIPIDSDSDDDIKETEEDDDDYKILKNIKTDKFIINKKNKSTKYTLNFNDENEQIGNQKQAIKWFKRFNNRNPSNIETQKIQQFVQIDNEQETTIDID